MSSQLGLMSASDLRRRPRQLTTRFFGFLASLSNGKKFAFTAIGGLTFMSSSIWYLQPSDHDRALANLLAQRGYYELATPAELYIPGTINTIEVRSDGKVDLHPTCKMDVGMLAKMTIKSRGLRDKLAIDDDRWGRLCAEHALPLGWESIEYKEFLRERRRRMADIIRVAFRQLGGEPESPPLTPPWFLPGAEAVWLRIVETERALRGVVREVYAARFGEAAAQRIEGALPERERETLARALRSRPAGSEPLSIVDYLYLGQLPRLLFEADVQQEARGRFSKGQDAKQRLLAAVGQIAPVRNEIAHVREVDRDRLLRASVACTDLLEMLQGRT